MDENCPERNMKYCSERKNLSRIFSFSKCFHKTLFPQVLKSQHCGKFSSGALFLFNPFPNTPFWDHPKLKEAADDNLNLAIKGFQDTDCIENIVEKGEIAHFEQFRLFLQCFPKYFFYNVLKWVYMEERVKQ